MPPLLFRHGEPYRIAQIERDGPALVVHPRFPCHDRLQPLVGKVVRPAVLHKERACLGKREAHIVRHTFATQRLHPAEVARTASGVVLPSADGPLYLPGVQVLFYAHRPYEGSAHDALVEKRQLQQKRYPFIGTLLVLAGDIEEDISSALSPVLRKALFHPLGPLRQEKEHDVRPLPHHLPGFITPGIGFLQEEV